MKLQNEDKLLDVQIHLEGFKGFLRTLENGPMNCDQPQFKLCRHKESNGTSTNSTKNEENVPVVYSNH